MGSIQLSIMLGGAFGGLLLDHLSIATTLLGSKALLVIAFLVMGSGARLRPSAGLAVAANAQPSVN